MKSLQSLLDKRKIKKKIFFSDKDIFYVFNRIIKEEFGNVGAVKLKADFFKNGIIFVNSESSSWGAELFSNRNMIIRKINDELGEGKILEIKLK